MKLFSSLFACATGAVLAVALPAQAQVPAYMGEVQLYAFDFCPRATVRADGSLLSVATNQALFALLSTNFGGNGIQTFAVPDLRGREPIGQGQGPGLLPHTLGEMAGWHTATLTIVNMPQHNHGGHLVGSNSPADTNTPGDAVLADFADGARVYNNDVPAGVPMQFGTISVSPAGGSQPYNNMKPYLAMNYCVVAQGIFPSRD